MITDRIGLHPVLLPLYPNKPDNCCLLLLACVLGGFYREAAITSGEAARSLGERQPRNRLHRWPAFFVSTVRWRTGHFHWSRRLKAGFHMIADDRGSRIADRKKFCDRLRSYGNTLLWSSAIVCDPLRSSAINCDRAIIWKPKFCDLRSKRIP